MMKKVIKLLSIILIFLLVINIFEMNNNKCYAQKANLPGLPDMEEWEEEERAEGLSGTGMTDVSKNPGSWTPNLTTGGQGLDDKVGIIASFIRTIGIIISVGTLSVIGIKFMLGSVDEKAHYKQTLIPWLIGAIMVFAITNLPMFIYNVSKGMFEETGGASGSTSIVTPNEGIVDDQMHIKD